MSRISQAPAPESVRVREVCTNCVSEPRPPSIAASLSYTLRSFLWLN
jgi:hypothetical protein